jgi:hypothetical protein
MEEDFAGNAFDLLAGWKTIRLKRKMRYFAFDFEFRYNPTKQTKELIAFNLQTEVEKHISTFNGTSVYVSDLDNYQWGKDLISITVRVPAFGSKSHYKTIHDEIQSNVNVHDTYAEKVSVEI